MNRLDAGSYRIQLDKSQIVSTELRFKKPGVVVAKTLDDARTAINDPLVDAILLPKEFSDIKIYPKDLTELQKFLQAIKKWQSSDRHIITGSSDFSVGPKKLVQEFCPRSIKTNPDSFLRVSTYCASLYQLLFEPNRMKHSLDFIPSWPTIPDGINSAHLQPYVAQSQEARHSDWPNSISIPLPEWYLKIPLFGSGLVIATGQDGCCHGEHQVFVELIPAIEELRACSTKLTQAKIIHTLEDFWHASAFDERKGVNVSLGQPVLLRHESKSCMGAVSWNSLSGKKHLNGKQVPSLSLIISGIKI